MPERPSEEGLEMATVVICILSLARFDGTTICRMHSIAQATAAYVCAGRTPDRGGDPAAPIATRSSSTAGQPATERLGATHDSLGARTDGWWLRRGRSSMAAIACAIECVLLMIASEACGTPNATSGRVTEGTQMTSQSLKTTSTDPTAGDVRIRRKILAGPAGSRRQAVAEHGARLLQPHWAAMPTNDPECLDMLGPDSPSAVNRSWRPATRSGAHGAGLDDVVLTVADLGRHRQTHAGSRMGHSPRGGRE